MFNKTRVCLTLLLVAISSTSYARDVFIPQGWTKTMEKVFYNIDLGTPMLHYDIYLALEKSNSEDLFVNDDNMKRLGFITRDRSLLNADGLPIGMTRDVIDSEVYAGINCSLCHTNNIEYTKPERERRIGNGRRPDKPNSRRDRTYNMRINGSGSMVLFGQFQQELLAALEATRNDSAKFDRLVVRALGRNPNQGEINKLSNRLEESYQIQALYGRASASTLEWGPGRVDAFTVASNFLTGYFNTESNIPHNIYPANAANSVMHIWGTPTADFLQWTGPIASFVTRQNPDPQAFAGATAASVIGSPALFGFVDIPDNINNSSYPSSVKLESIRIVDTLMLALKSPRWPSRILPSIDRRMARRGKDLFDDNCSSCHTVIRRAFEALPYSVTMTPLVEIQTDPAAIDFLLRDYLSGDLEGRLTQGFVGDEIGATGELLELGSNVFVGMLVGKLGDEIDPLISVEFNPFLFGSSKQVIGYKARPLNGIWATAPFLHNGSVPNLYELLLPADERSEAFYVGSRQYDPVNVGFITERDDESDIEPFLFNTNIRGNYNSGHEIAVDISEDERWDLIEYIKTL